MRQRDEKRVHEVSEYIEGRVLHRDGKGGTRR